MALIKSTLISAYACEPNKGSEPGVGWNWVIELAKMDYQVHVITRANNRRAIENEKGILEEFSNLEFHYYDLPKWIRTLKKLPFGIYFYYFFWQCGVVSKVKNIISNNNIDIVHHLTFGSFRQPSFLYKIKKPFVFGPVGGAEMAPFKLLKSLPFKELVFEIFRNTANHLARLSPILFFMYKNTDIILCRTSETANMIPSRFNNKFFLQLDIGSRNFGVAQKQNDNPKLKILYVGRFIGWKGAHIAIKAVNLANLEKNHISLTLIGDGRLKPHLKKISNNNSSIEFIDWLDQKELFKYYSSYDCFLFPSFHDSGGSVVLEALGFGLPVICLNLGGPANIVNKDSGIIIDVQNKTEQTIVNEISETLKNLQTHRKKLKDLSEGAIKRAEYFRWTNIVQRAYSIIKDNI